MLSEEMSDLIYNLKETEDLAKIADGDTLTLNYRMYEILGKISYFEPSQG